MQLENLKPETKNKNLLMILNRQKALLAYIDMSGKIYKTVLMKSLFLFSKKFKHQKTHDFFPYLYGPYSWSLDKVDLKSLIKKNLISNNPYRIVDKKKVGDIVSNIDNELLNSLKLINEKFGHMPAWKIKNFVYRKFPYFAIENTNNKASYSKHDPRLDAKLHGPKIFTIGYEKKSLEQFLNELITHNVNVLVDIRSNPKSMKFGFSGSQLEHYLKGIGIEYVNVPGLGIESKHRSDLESEQDYTELFKYYEKSIIPKATNNLKQLHSLLKEGNRIGLMCFERDQNFCHRSRAAKHLITMTRGKFELENL